MINIMYLVLTAMLALNVSAEIINAFFMIDRGIAGSNAVLEESNDLALTALELNAEQDMSRYQPLVTTAKEVRSLSKEFNSYIDQLRDELVQETGGYYPEDDDKHPGQPKGYKNKDVTTRVLVNQGRADELQERIESTRAELVSKLQQLKGIQGTQINDATIEELQGSITLGISNDWERANAPSWGYYTFNQMPLASIFPILRKMQNDMKSSEAAVLNYLVNQVGVKTFKVDNFLPIASARQSYVIAGEPYEAEITIGASSKSVYDNMSVRVNGANLPVTDGVAKYTATASNPGMQEYNVDITLTNPTTGEVETYSKKFNYEVGRRSVAVAADKMNVFYVGVDNPITVSAAGVSSNELNVTATGTPLRKTGASSFVASPNAPGEATIRVSGGGLTPTNFAFRVKRIPDPQARLSNSVGGTMGTGEFKAQGGVGAYLDNFDFDATCQVVGFELVYVPKRQDPVPVQNPGARYGDDARRIVNMAKPGDTYFFNNVRAKCPGDNASRQINSLVFNIR